MPSSTQRPTRRRFVASAVSLLCGTALAGCGGLDSATGSASGSSREGPDARPPADALVDPPHVSLRNAEPKPNVWSETPTETATPEGDEKPAIDEWAHHVVASDEAAADLTFADVEGADEARAFLEATDFDAETVYVERHVVGECYRHRLCWIRWTESEIETDYAWILRDADVACEADARDAVTKLIRLPVALDPDEISSYGSSSGSGRCRRPEGAGEPTEVDAS
ncbi:MAG: hypothetical protein ABEJ97_01310 [Halobellus sp.]